MTASEEDSIRRVHDSQPWKEHTGFGKKRRTRGEFLETPRRMSHSSDIQMGEESNAIEDEDDFGQPEITMAKSSKSRLKELIQKSREKRRRNQAKLRGTSTLGEIAGGIFSQDKVTESSWRQRLPPRRRKRTFMEEVRRNMQLMLGLISEDEDEDNERNSFKDPKASFITPPQHAQPDYSVRELRKMHSLRVQQWVESGAFYAYNEPTVKRNTTLPDPFVQYPNDTMVVIVLSSRSNQQNRNAIRETWANNHSVFFVIGGPTSNESSSMQNELLRESSRYRDMIDSIHPESYISLPFKLHFAYRWIVQHMPRVRWILKADDDCVVRVATIKRSLLDTYNHERPVVLGKINPSSKVSRKGKWREFHYEKPFYPYWPQGSRGHVVSRPIADYLSKQHNLTYYQGEDTSLGIWLDESPLKVTWVHSLYFQNHGRCKENEWLVIGHKLGADEIRTCHQAMDEWGEDQWEDPARRLFYIETRQQRRGAMAAAKQSNFGVPDIPPELTESRPDDALQF